MPPRSRQPRAPMTPRPDSSIAAARIDAAEHRCIPRMGSGETWQKRASCTLAQMKGDFVGKVRLRFVLRWPGMAIRIRDAFPGGWLWQYIDAMRSPTSNSGNYFASCILEGASDGKIISSRQDSRAMYPKRAGFGKICAPCIRKAPQIAFRECMARRSCQGGSLFAALTPRITHGAQILPQFSARKVLRAEGWRRWVVASALCIEADGPTL